MTDLSMDIGHNSSVADSQQPHDTCSMGPKVLPNSEMEVDNPEGMTLAPEKGNNGKKTKKSPSNAIGPLEKGGPSQSTTPNWGDQVEQEDGAVDKNARGHEVVDNDDDASEIALGFASESDGEGRNEVTDEEEEEGYFRVVNKKREKRRQKGKAPREGERLQGGKSLKEGDPNK